MKKLGTYLSLILLSAVSFAAKADDDNGIYFLSIDKSTAAKLNLSASKMTWCILNLSKVPSYIPFDIKQEGTKINIIPVPAGWTISGFNLDGTAPNRTLTMIPIDSSSQAGVVFSEAPLATINANPNTKGCDFSR